MTIEKIFEIVSIEAPFTGYLHVPIRRSLDAGKETQEAKETIIRRDSEDERKRIQPIYNAKGKIIKYDKYGRHLDVFA